MAAIVCPNCKGGGVVWDNVDRRHESCHLCDGTGYVDSETFQSVEPESEAERQARREATRRILFSDEYRLDVPEQKRKRSRER